jgi:hypothetical protein
MRYNDKNTQRSWVKQIDKEDEVKSDRNLRRERERGMKEFSYQVCLFTDKDWWDCVTPEQKETLYSTWISRKFRNRFSNGDADNIVTLDKWINEMKSEVVIDKALYREKKINRLGI